MYFEDIYEANQSLTRASISEALAAINHKGNSLLIRALMTVEEKVYTFNANRIIDIMIMFILLVVQYDELRLPYWEGAEVYLSLVSAESQV